MNALAIATITVLALAACNRDRIETPQGAANDTVMANSDAASSGTATTAPPANPPPVAPAPTAIADPGTDGAPAPANVIAEGQSVYKARCATCHGPDGRKNAANVILTSAATQSRPDRDLIRIIRETGPHRGLTFSDAQTAAVVSYIKALR